MPFEKWMQKGKKITRPFVALGPDGELYLSKTCEEMLDFGDFVTLWFDPKTRQVGLRPARADEEAAYKVYRHSRTGRASISAKSFLKAYGIVPSGRPRYYCKMIKGMVCFWVGGGEDEDEELSSD